MSFQKSTETKILEWARTDLNRFGAYLQSGQVHGKPGLPVAELGRIEKVLRKNLIPAELFQLAKKLLARPEYCARNLGVGLVENGWPGIKEVEKLIRLAAEDESWIVREYSASSFARLLNKDFPHFSKLFLEWSKNGSVNVKRAIALGVKYDCYSAKPERVKTYFRLIDPLLGEEAEYIRKNLGPFAIGDGLLSRFPKETLAACGKWAKHKNENVRWNCAMVFTAAAARNFKLEGSALLEKLEKDPVPLVARAAKRARKNLAKA